MRHLALLAGACIAAIAVLACGDDYDTPTTPQTPAAPAPQLVQGSGDITTAVTQYRTLLGEPRNGGAVGPSATGRREIGWDGVPAEFNNGDNRFPANFFNQNVRLGVVMTTPGTGFRNDSSLFGDIDATFQGQFGTFSPNKLFTVSNGNVLDVEFQLAGQPTKAVVAGFGAVFVDVDLPGLTTLEYFGVDDQRLARVEVPIHTAGSPLSFVGARFPSPIVARVRITLGNGPIGAALRDISDGGTRDIVVLDDFLYAEPQPIR